MVARISPMVAAKLVTLRKTNPSETLLIAGLKRTLSNDLGTLTFGVFVKLERSSYAKALAEVPIRYHVQTV